jgi:hypothetical protein
MESPIETTSRKRDASSDHTVNDVSRQILFQCVLVLMENFNIYTGGHEFRVPRISSFKKENC